MVGRWGRVWCAVVAVVGVGCAPLSAVAVPVVPVAVPVSSSASVGDGRLARERAWWISGLGVDRSLVVSRGAGVTVCLVDSGVDVKHPDLVGVRIEAGTDTSEKGGTDGLKPTSDHGTSMAGFIAGLGSGPGRSEGVLGAAPEARVISVTSSASLGVTWSDSLTKAIRYCVGRGAKVINLSMTGGIDGHGKVAALVEAQEKDVVIVAGAGNDGDTDGGSWARVFGVLQVGGVMADLQLDPKSNRGVARQPNGVLYGQGNGVCGPFSVRPGVPVIGPLPGGGYYASGGTSSATAVVSGVVAAVRSKYPELSAGQVIRRVLATAKRNGDGAVPDEKCGWGVVDAYAAVTADVPAGSKENPLGRLKAGATSDRFSFDTESMGEWDPSFKPDAPVAPQKPPVTQYDKDKWFIWAAVALWGTAAAAVVAGGIGGVVWLRRRLRSRAGR
ncbi:S8 family serine peptidase [Austwickia chelonae]|uniref:S8 family serine peptidase n=1 Tax=Austwickia chelonae TaxID=100225 RepID=UPI0019684411|nr:S8 family serine peptidase [Austwickia chelonae]